MPYNLWNALEWLRNNIFWVAIIIALVALAGMMV